MSKPNIRAGALFPAAFNVHCPACNEPVGNPDDGCLIWEEHQVKRAAVEFRHFPCACGTAVYLTRPKTMKTNLQ
jgi:hypothetical protein